MRIVETWPSAIINNVMQLRPNHRFPVRVATGIALFGDLVGSGMLMVGSGVAFSPDLSLRPAGWGLIAGGIAVQAISQSAFYWVGMEVTRCTEADVPETGPYPKQEGGTMMLGIAGAAMEVAAGSLFGRVPLDPYHNPIGYLVGGVGVMEVLGCAGLLYSMGREVVPRPRADRNLDR